jgi:hypothetical protein
MDAFNAAVDSLLRWYFAAFRWSPGVGLALFSAVVGVAMLWVFQKTSNQRRIRAVKRRVGAHLLELRIFRDEPGVMWRAQKSLLGANLRYMGLMLRPALFLTVPIVLLLVHLDGFYGRAPLAVGQEAVVTVEFEKPLDPRAAPPVLLAPKGIAVETPPVRVLDERQVSWRIRVLEPVSGALRIVVGGQTIEKRIEAGAGPRFVPGRREGSVLGVVWHPDEPRIRAGAVAWIDVPHPETGFAWLGLRMHWLIWFTILSMAAALLLKKRFHVAI